MVKNKLFSCLIKLGIVIGGNVQILGIIIDIENNFISKGTIISITKAFATRGLTKY